MTTLKCHCFSSLVKIKYIYIHVNLKQQQMLLFYLIGKRKKKH